MEALQAFSIEDLIAEVKAKILERSSGGIKGIARIFKAMDDNGNRQLDIDDFRWGFIDYGFNLTQDEARQLLDHFDRNGDGVISYDEFLRALKVSSHLILGVSKKVLICQFRVSDLNLCSLNLCLGRP